MRSKAPVPFKIGSMDGLGQGVSKADGAVTFIPKTLPGEEGRALILESKKGVHFAEATELSQVSPERITPACPHFSDCPSCHFLHTSYEAELRYKQEALARIFRKLPVPAIEVFGAPERLGYRNRIQLHYDTKSRRLGFLHQRRGTIVEVPTCLLPVPEIRAEVQRLYHGGRWLQEVPPGRSRGHVELYWSEGLLKRTWDAPYAAGGFTQVNAPMNELLRRRLKDWAALASPSHLLDLFAGNGNVSEKLNHSGRLCVDVYEGKTPGDEFLAQNLYEKQGLQTVLKELGRRGLRPEVLLLDPPRSGFTFLADWARELSPRAIGYVSCDPHTLARDVAPLMPEYRIEALCLFDFFPSTFHFESLLFLQRNS
jgi:23S rRNA (uracil1939-C5)-methyltransferase